MTIESTDSVTGSTRYTSETSSSARQRDTASVPSGSAASDQSRPLPDRHTYLDRVEDLWSAHEAQGRVPRPPHWTGFTLCPTRIEFWIDRDNRLHDRREFTRTDPQAPWSDTLLYP
jgi:pyridoxamine 5'-phosphate oxidase